MTDVRIYGFPVSTYVNIVRLILTHKNIPYTFHDLEPEMGSDVHRALHPFERVPILEHDGFRVYEAVAIAHYVDEVFPEPSLKPAKSQPRARMNQWISSVSSYYYPYLTYHLGHERLIYPALGIPADEKVVAYALPRIALALDVLESELAHGGDYLIGNQLTLADFFLLPTMTGLGLTPEGQAMLGSRPRIGGWRARMEALPSSMEVRASVAPHFGKPVEHARRWVDTHRPRY